MWRWLVVLVIVVLALMPSMALAADPTVTITVSKWVVGLPSGLILTYVSDYEIDIDWTPGVGSVNTMIRAAYGRPLVNITDGFEVYYGDDSSTTLWVSNVATTGPIYISAWSENALGIWSPMGPTEEGNFMSASYLFLGLIGLALGATSLSFWRRSIVLSMGAALSWLVLGLLLLTTPVILSIYPLTEGWVQVLAFLFFAMTAGCLLWYMSGIGKTKITMTNVKGQTYQVYGKPIEEKRPTRAQLAKERHRARLQVIGERYGRRGRR